MALPQQSLRADPTDQPFSSHREAYNRDLRRGMRLREKAAATWANRWSDDPNHIERNPLELEGGNLTDLTCDVGGAEVDVGEDALPCEVPPK